MRVPPLTEAEKNRWYSKFFYERYEPAPEALAEIGDNGPMGLENAVSVADRLTVVRDGYFNRERGWQVMPDGTTFVAGFIFMKDVTPDMFQWWFSWMPVDGLRGRLWDPEEHLNLVVDPESIKRMCNSDLSVKERIYGNLLYAVEDNGTGYESDRYSWKKLNFRNPVDFGFTQEQLDAIEAKGGRVITAMSGPKDGDYASTFIHYARPAEGGCEVRSRFFVGYKMDHGQLIKTMADDMPQKALEQIGTGLTMHCLKEYTNLGHILPELYAKEGHKVDTIEEYNTLYTRDFSDFT